MDGFAMKPFLSVCIMTYNRAETLRETLDSILPQAASLLNVEVLVSDNASTDKTAEVVHEYGTANPGLRYSRNPQNVGFDGNVVACIENANGEYLAFFSDDDIAPSGYLEGLVKDLDESRPIAAYVNHTPFFHDNPAELSAPTQPVLKRLFTNPAEFFLYTGLGFISSLILKTENARRYTASAVHGRGNAHLDIAARVVLTSTGPFLFDGTLTVLARNDYASGYDPLRYGSMDTTRVHLDLLRDGLLTQANVDWHNRKTIRLFLRRHIVNNRIKQRGDAIISARDLRGLYGRDPLFYVYAWPLLIIPPPLLRWIAIPLRSLMRMRRRITLKYGRIGVPPPHLAPPL